MNHKDLAVIIMAAGQGKRMQNPDKAKVMHTLAGIPLIEHVVRLARTVGATRIITVVGHQRQSVIQHLQQSDHTLEVAVQVEQLGTGHAVLQAKPLLDGFTGDVLILSGDAPLTQPGTIRHMIEEHYIHQAAVTVLTAELPDPTGYGRVIRNDDGMIRKIVEHKDASDEERGVHEINSGIYIFDAVRLFYALVQVTNDNAQGEFYLPDVFSIFARNTLSMIPVVISSFDEIRGVNTMEQLQEMEKIYARSTAGQSNAFSGSMINDDVRV